MDLSVFADVQPVSESEPESAVCKIMYSPEYKRLMDIYRALLKAEELSQRALDLTTEIIVYNAAHYSVWHFRRRVLFAIDANLLDELSYMDEVIRDSPKNYQVWYHRQKVVEHLGDGSAEMQFTKSVLQLDAKNYHAWTYRQWAMEHFNLFSKLRDSGLGFVDELLEEDVFNNSAWNHRYFVIDKTTGFTSDVLEREYTYTLDKIKLAPNNESSFSYLKGLIRQSGQHYHEIKRPIAVCETLAQEADPSPYVLAFLVLVHSSAAKATQGEQRQHVAAGTKICEQLKEIDSVRVKYWDLKSADLQRILAEGSQ
eukprot:m.7617 g.7617  ORF g.7617 m.7617 type:complete len:312 (-) comp5259_c0_seq1:153-1088(-)